MTGLRVAYPAQREQLQAFMPVTYSSAYAASSSAVAPTRSLDASLGSPTGPHASAPVSPLAGSSPPTSHPTPSSPGLDSSIASSSASPDMSPELALALAAGAPPGSVPEDEATAAAAEPFVAPDSRNVAGTFRYMFTTPKERAENLDGRLGEMTDAIAKMYKVEHLLAPVGTVSQEPVVYVGRVCVASETGDGKINRSSVLLEGLHEDGTNGMVSLDLSEVAGLSLFPGQIVGVKGINARGDRLVVQAIYHGAPLPPSALPLENALALCDAAQQAKSGPLRVWMAAGPFCTHANFDYTPLTDLFLEMSAAPIAPDVIILVGAAVNWGLSCLPLKRTLMTSPQHLRLCAHSTLSNRPCTHTHARAHISSLTSRCVAANVSGSCQLCV